MKARPILFSGAMVRALLAGTKTQTRRTIKWPRGAASCVCQPPAWRCDNGWYCATCGGGVRLTARDVANTDCPYGVPGDLLVVRETWACHYATNDQRPADIDPNLWSVRYAADGHIRPAASDGSRALPQQFTKTRVSIHMPRWASRLTLEITEVRVERLREISISDAKVEGIVQLRGADKDGMQHWGVPGLNIDAPMPDTAYLRLWAHINGDGAAAANPWVWAVSFKVHQQNVDALLSERVAA
jgi:hypothetical protein